MTNRKKYLDYAKGLGIILVMFAHSIQYFQAMGSVNKFVCSFHVPVFFVAAGFLAWVTREKKSTFGNIAKKRAKALLIPYVIYSLFNTILKFSVLFLKRSITEEQIKEEITALLITGNGTVWFLLTLFAVELVFTLLRGYMKKVFPFLMVICLVLPYLFYPIWCDPIGIVVLRIISGLGFYQFGYFLCGKIEGYSKNVDTVFVIFLILGLASYSVWGSNYSFFEGRFGKPTLSVITGVLLSSAVVLGCVCLENHFGDRSAMHILEYYGKNSLIVMLIHPTILLLFTYPFAGKFWEMGGPSIIIALALFIFVTVIEVPIIFVVNRWFGWTLGRIKVR